MDDNLLKQVPKFKYLGSIITEDGKNKEDIIQWIKEAKVMLNNKKQLLCSNNISLEMKKKLTKSCIWNVALYGSETWTPGKNGEDYKCIWNMVLEKSVKNKMNWQNSEWWSFSKGERRMITFKNLKKTDATHE